MKSGSVLLEFNALLNIRASYGLNEMTVLNISLCLQADVSGKVFADEAAGLYERATTTMLKNCTLLYFAYADFEEVLSGGYGYVVCA